MRPRQGRRPLVLALGVGLARHETPPRARAQADAMRRVGVFSPGQADDPALIEPLFEEMCSDRVIE